MSASAILVHLREAGVTVAAEGGELKLKGPSAALTEPVLNELRAHKPELLTLLSHVEAAPPAQRDHDNAAERIEAWLSGLDKLPKACGPQGQRLRAISKEFARDPWAYEAVRLGWSDADLFAIDGGLIPEMSRRPLHFRAIGEDAISLINGRGQYEEWERRDMTDAMPWWEDDRCVARFH